MLWIEPYFYLTPLKITHSVMATTLLSSYVSLNGLTDFARSAPADDVAVLGLALVASAGYLLKGIVWDRPDPYHYTWFERPQEKDSAARNLQKETRNIAQKLEETVR